MVAEAGGVARLLMFNPASGSMTPAIEEKLRAAFPDHQVVAIEEGQDLSEAYGACPTADDAQVVVAGGDGTAEGIARCLAGSKRLLGLVPMGTFNNFARSLDVPLDFDAAISNVKEGSPRAVSVGWVDDRPFLEAAAVGLFGEIVSLGESAKELRYGELGQRLRQVARAASFDFVLEGDVNLRGRAQSLLFANTPTFGALMPVAETTPHDAYLELEIMVAGSRLAALRGLILGLLRRSGTASRKLRVRNVRVTAQPPAQAFADAFGAGRTPVQVRLQAGGLRVILPVR